MTKNAVIKMTITKLKDINENPGYVYHEYHVEDALLECIRLLTHCPEAYFEMEKQYKENRDMDYLDRAARNWRTHIKKA